MLKNNKLLFLITSSIIYPAILSASMSTELSGSFNKVELEDSKVFYLSILSDVDYASKCATKECLEKAGADINKQALLSNEWQRNSVSSFINEHREEYAGTVISGDITAYGAKSQFDMFNSIYRKGENHLTTGYNGAIGEFPMFMGLGANDYLNNVNKCGSKYVSPIEHPEEAENHCTYRSIMYLKSNIDKLKEGGFDVNFDYQRVENDNCKYGCEEANREFDNIKGSLAYSWDIGNVHFVQLNSSAEVKSYPSFKYGLGYSVELQNVQKWLEKDLKRIPQDRLIVIIAHHFGQGEFFRIMNAELIPLNHRIMTMFVGDYPEKIGSQYSGESMFYENMPIFYMSSAEYNGYLQVRFEETRGENSVSYRMDVSSIKSVFGNTDIYEESPSETNSLVNHSVFPSRFYNFKAVDSRTISWALPKYGTITSKRENLCMDVWENKIEPKVPVKLYECHGRDNQQWHYNPFSKQLTTKADPTYCLTADNIPTNNSLYIEKCEGLNPLQQWNIEDNMIISEKDSEFVIDAYNNLDISIWKKHGLPHQRWIMPNIK